MANLPINNAEIGAWYLEALKKVGNYAELTSQFEDLIDTTVVIYGSGPFSQKEFKDFLWMCRYVYDLAMVSSPSTFQDFLETCDPYDIVLIVGHREWDADELSELVQVCLKFSQDGKLKVYSQEMFLFYVLTGIDPYNAPSNVREVFTSGHPALDSSTHLDRHSLIIEDLDMEVNLEIENDPPFKLSKSGPFSSSQNISSDKSSRQSDGDRYYADNGILKDFGYEVGKSGISDQRKRKTILREIFYAKKLPKLPNVRLEEWGSPRSEQRLHKMANCLAYFAKNPQNRKSNKVMARKSWINDLEWLKEEFYLPGGYLFPWPITEW